MSNKTNMWKDAPEGTEFIAEFEYGEVHYYKTIGVTLWVCTPSRLRYQGWRTSYFEDLNELVSDKEDGPKEIHFKPE